MSCYRYFLAKKLLIVSLMFLLVACGGGGGSSPETEAPAGSETNAGYSSTAVHTTAVASSVQCPNGGIEIHTGVDVDRSGLLEQLEVTNTQQLCHMDARLVMAEVEVLLPETDCSNGGHKLTIGYDQDNDNEIDTAEINQTLLFCDQNPFANLAMAVFSEFEEPQGENCVYGGYGRSVGIDKNHNGLLDQSEVTSSQYQCLSNQGLTLTPVEEYHYCSAFYCGDYTPGYQYLFIQGITEPRAIGRIFDDGVGEVTIIADDKAPEWLEFTLSEPYYEYNPYVYYPDDDSPSLQSAYTILVNQENIPVDAVGQVFAVTLTVSDGESSVELEKQFKVVAPIEVSFETESLTFTESGDGSIQTAFVKVNFSRPLPSHSLAASNHYYHEDKVYLTRFRVPENGDEPVYSSSDSDFSFAWLNSDFFAGQTQATLMLEVKDDSLPEATETFRLELDFPGIPEEELYFVNDSLDIRISDDESDVPIVATVALAQTSVTEGSPEDETVTSMSASSVTLTFQDLSNLEVSTNADGLTVLPFTVNFEPAIPQNGSFSLTLSRKDSTGSVTPDLGFNCSRSYSSNYYCDNDITVNLLKGATSYSGEIEIIRDTNKELDESFVLELGAHSSFVIENVTTEFTVLDDDEAPVIGFESTVKDAYYKSRLIYVPIKLDNTTSVDVVFRVSGTEGDSAEEGIHYDFAVSQPISMPPGKTSFLLPLIMYGVEFEQDQIEINLGITVESGATINPDAQNVKIVLDKIEPYSATHSSFSPPYSGEDSGWIIDKEALFMDEAHHVYLTGEVRNGYALDGFESAGSDDVFISKFKLDGTHIWSQQFGTSSYDSPNFQFDAKSGTAFHTRGNTITRITSEGVVTVIEYPGINGTLQLKMDDQQNLYVLSAGSYYSSSDNDGDGYLSNISLAKYNSDIELQWLVDDFTDIEAAHTQVRLEDLSLVLNVAGKPFLLAKTYYSSSLLGLPGLGGDDHVSFSFSSETGVVESYQRFGTDQSDDGFINATAYKEDQILGYYLARSNSNLGEVAIGTSQRIVEVIFNADGSVFSEKLVDNVIGNASLGRIYRSSDDSYFYESTRYSSTDRLYKLGEDLAVLAGSSGSFGSSSRASHEPILSSDGGYYYVTNEKIYKLTPNLSVR